MLNLSDKELDRLSRDAADQYDPGDFTSSGSWDKLEWRLDKELGRISRPNPFRGLRGIRRLPFYYAPVIVLLVGAGIVGMVLKYGKSANTNSPASPVAARSEPSGSPPMAVVKPLTPASADKDSFISKPGTTYKATSTPDKIQGAEPVASGNTAANAPASGNAVAGVSTANGRSAAHGNAATASGNSVTASGNPAATPGNVTTAPGSSAAVPGGLATTRKPTPASANKHSGTSGLSTTSGETPASATSDARHSALPTSSDNLSSSNLSLSNRSSKIVSGKTHHPHRNAASGLPSSDRNNPSGVPDHSTAPGLSTASGQPGQISHQASQTSRASVATTAPTAVREANQSSVAAPHTLARRSTVNDASLRHFTAKSTVATPIKLDKKNASLHVNRRLEFGLLLAPDFSSVNALAGDKPGSSLGLTMDYQIVDRLYIGTGILFSRKNYAARAQDYHAPPTFYRANNIDKVDFVKGTFNMIEIPLNLRYDFSVVGNTMFFFSGGVSSYLRTSEDCNYYYNFFGREACQGFNYPARDNYLFSAVNLSLGVETGISNNLSILVAPYMKIPTRGIGFGQVQMSSVGINFGLKYAPVLSRKKH